MIDIDIGSILLMFVGIIFCGLGLFVCIDYFRFNRNTIKTQGTITDYNVQISKNKRKAYQPIFEYTIKGHTYEVKSKRSFTYHVIPIGQSADVLYSQGNEEGARLAKGNDCIIGIFFMILGAIIFYGGL